MRFVKILVIIAVLVVGGLGTAWYIQANKAKQQVTAFLADTTKKLAESQVELSYGEIKSSGFPLNVRVQINNPQIVLKKTDAASQITVKSSNPLTFGRGLTDTAYHAILPKEFAIDSIIEGKEESYVVSYKQSPRIEVKLIGHDLLTLLTEDTKTSSDDVIKAFRSFTYTDAGSSMTDKKSGTVLYTQGASNIQVVTSLENTRRKIDFVLKGLNAKIADGQSPEALGPLAKEFLGAQKLLGNTTVAINLSADLPENTKEIVTSSGSLEFRDFSIMTDLYGFNIKGKVEKAASDFIPYGQVTVALNNYGGLLDSYATSMSTDQQKNPVIAGTPIGSKVSKEMAEAAKQFLRKISDDPTGNGKDLKITIRREQGSGINDVMVGTLSAEQLMQLSEEAKNVINPGSGTPAATDATSAPTAGTAPAAPTTSAAPATEAPAATPAPATVVPNVVTPSESNTPSAPAAATPNAAAPTSATPTAPVAAPTASGTASPEDNKEVAE